MNPWPRFVPGRDSWWDFFVAATVAASSTYVIGEAAVPMRVISAGEITTTAEHTARDLAAHRWIAGWVNWVTSGLPVIRSQLHETVFADLLQFLPRLSNQGHCRLLQLCY